MENLPVSGRGEIYETEPNEQIKNVAKKTIEAMRNKPVSPDVDYTEEAVKKITRAVDIISDHFPPEILKPEPGSKKIETEQDYRDAFDTFRQVRLIPVRESRGGYHFDDEILPYKETVYSNIELTRDTVMYLAGETGNQPRTDVAIYLDKSARPVSWFVNDFWDSFTDKPRPRTEHLHIDRVQWFNNFKVGLGQGEYKKGTLELASWRDFPLHEVTNDDVLVLRQALKNNLITNQKIADGRGLGVTLSGEQTRENKIKNKFKDEVYEEVDFDKRHERGEVSLAQFKSYEAEILRRAGLFASLANNPLRLKNTYNALTIAAKLRGLFIEGGITEEDIENPERIWNYPTIMDGKNITIIDEVERSGTTGELAKHFISWAFPEAKSVNFYVYCSRPETLIDRSSTQHGQLLKIPFWYPVTHDDGMGRGILDPDEEFYRELYKKKPNGRTLALVQGLEFVGVPMEYEEEIEEKSLRLREQIARLHAEYEKGNLR